MEAKQSSPTSAAPVAATAVPPAEPARTIPNGASVVGQRTEEAPADTARASTSGQPASWNPAFWSYAHHTAVQFASEADLDAAIDLLWNDRELRGLPRVHVGDNTMIVPTESVETLRTKTRPFAIQPVVSAGDVPPEEAQQVRRGTTA